jgi:ribosomal protein S12 methylthiotransferase accessory factor
MIGDDTLLSGQRELSLPSVLGPTLRVVEPARGPHAQVPGEVTIVADAGGIESLLQPQGGLVGAITRFRADSAEPGLTTCVAALGDLRQVNASVSANGAGQVASSGTGLVERDARFVALAEALERYCTCVYSSAQFIWATADELGPEALDLDRIPRCSDAELSHSRCPLVAPDKKRPIRWVRSLSLSDGRLVYVPVVMVYLHAGVAHPAERFWLPITTGCAGHVTYEQALSNAILEVIERDAVSIVWLQRLSLPRIEIDELSPALAPVWERYERSSGDLEYVFFDATTNLGVPTVYGLQIARGSSHSRTLVSCSAHRNPAVAVAKVVRDMGGMRVAFRKPRKAPESFDDFTDVFHGATYMAAAERADAFGFLMRSTARRRLSEIDGVSRTEEKQDLCDILEILRSNHLEAYAVDLSTDEAIRVGARVVRVIIPALQPMTFHYRARYLGHPRLYEAPKQMGYPVCHERELNRCPQPFA